MWSHRSPSRVILPVALALFALVALLQRQETFESGVERRLGLPSIAGSDISDPKSSSLRTIKTYKDLVNEDSPLPPYSIKDVIASAGQFQSRYALLRYDPGSDKFIGYYSNNHLYVSGCSKMNYAIKQLTMILRAVFPDRFTPDSSELVLAIEAGDYPDAMPYRVCVVKNPNKPCNKKFLSGAPIMAFGSIFSNPLFPNQMAFPMPGDHLTCMLRWVTRKEVCPFFHPRAEWPDLSWEELNPQLVWRGTDFNFISIQKHHERPAFDEYYGDAESEPSDEQDEVAIEMLKHSFNNLLPRWQGAVLTAEAEIEARRTNTVPKLNMKFPSTSLKDQRWGHTGFGGVGERMPKSELATYKYHIDIGGGGGTTWTGTVDKLQMPGLLFHHETVSKDYIHDDIEPWVHYVPVKSDLSDVVEKLEWAESHPAQAKLIAENASQFMARLNTAEGFEEFFMKHMVNPLVKIIEAYQPMNLRNEEEWNKVFPGLGGDQWTPLIECDGINKDCSILQAAKNYDERDPSHTPLNKIHWGANTSNKK